MFAENIQSSSRKAMALQDLDEYSLVHVFLFLSVADLDRCLLVCKKFQHIIQRIVFPKKCLFALVVNSPKTLNLSLYQYTTRKRAKLEENWRDGRYEEHTLFNHNVMYISQMDIDKNHLYMTHGGCLQAHKRTKSRYLVDTRVHWQVGSRRDPDISSLAKENDRFFAGRLDGKIMIYESGTGQTTLQSVTTDVIKSVDFFQNVYAVTTKFHATYILNHSWQEQDFENAELRHAHVYPRAYETIKLKGTRLAAGMFHCGKGQALQMIDLQSCDVVQLNSQTKAVYDLIWKDENCLLTGNFDDSMRLVDIRTGNDEACWSDPYNASVYCMFFNGAYAVHCGMKYHHRSNLYDLRVPNRCVQMYFPSKRKHSFSPVYGIKADVAQLFLVTDYNLRVLHFNADWAAKKDYASI